MKVNKKNIKLTVEAAMEAALQKLSVSAPSKKTKKVLAKAAKSVARRLNVEVKDLQKKMKPAKLSGKKKIESSHKEEVAA